LGSDAENGSEQSGGSDQNARSGDLERKHDGMNAYLAIHYSCQAAHTAETMDATKTVHAPEAMAAEAAHRAGG
jgi:hypothetical protein